VNAPEGTGWRAAVFRPRAGRFGRRFGEIDEMRFRVGLLSAAGLLAVPFAMPSAAQAQGVQGLYIGAGAGYNLPMAPKTTAYGGGFSYGPSPAGGDLRLNQNGGFAGVTSLGYGFGNGIRMEVEGDFMQNNMNKVTGTAFPTVSNGNVRNWGVMANAYYDFNVGLPWMTPYLGVGAGYQFTHLHNVSATQAGGPFTFGSDDTSGHFAYQGIVGAAFPISSLPYMGGVNMPGLFLTAEYRFMDITGGAKFNAATVVGNTYTTSTLKLHNQYYNSFLIGLRYDFGAAPPPPTPMPVSAPAPAPSRSYLVFFDWDKATLSDRARQIISEAAANSTKVQYTRIEVNGYTDTSGSPQYNMGLSVRRAQAVAAELVHDGVPRNAISIQGFGQTHLLVPTADGVREPQNRRVEIIIR
jgi:outer membrane protein OmpA-like peptidoglycan-associated protein